MKFRNPIIPGFHPDPSICRVGDDYYLVTSSFEYFPGVPLFHSRDLVNWEPIGHCLTRASQLPLERARSSGGIWAPTIREHHGVLYMITTNTTDRGTFVVRATDPRGSWSEPTWLDVPGIDPSILFDEGRVYVCYPGSRGIEQCEVDLETGRRLGEPRALWSGTGGRCLEGPHLYREQGRYYLLAAEGGTEHGHMVNVARSESPWGPFEPCPGNPILTHRSTMSPIQNLGHADFVQGPDGATWMVCLGVRPVGYPECHHLGREAFLAPVHWVEQWPVVGSNGRIALEMDAPAGGAPQSPAPTERDDFADGVLGPSFTYLRNPRAESYSLTQRPSHLRLRGSAVSLDDVDAPTWLGRRQQHLSCTMSVSLDFDARDGRDEAGLTLRQNEEHHYEIFVTSRRGRRVAVVRLRIGPLAREVAEREIASGPCQLAIQAALERYRFFAGNEELATAPTRYLATEVAGGFTGVFVAMYASGNGRPCIAPADFDWFEYRPESV